MPRNSNFHVSPPLSLSLEDNMASVKECIEALKDTAKFSNFTGKSFLAKLLRPLRISQRSFSQASSLMLSFLSICCGWSPLKFMLEFNPNACEERELDW